MYVMYIREYIYYLDLVHIPNVHIAEQLYTQLQLQLYSSIRDHPILSYHVRSQARASLDPTPSTIRPTCTSSLKRELNTKDTK